MKLVRQRQIPYDFTHVWNLRNKTDEPGQGKKKGKPGNRLFTIQNKVKVDGGEVGRGMVK